MDPDKIEMVSSCAHITAFFNWLLQDNNESAYESIYVVPKSKIETSWVNEAFIAYF